MAPVPLSRALGSVPRLVRAGLFVLALSSAAAAEESSSAAETNPKNEGFTERASNGSTQETQGGQVEAEQRVRLQAKALYEQGLQAYRRGQYVEAIDFLVEANNLLPRPQFSYNIGLAYEALRDNTSALKWFRDYRRQIENPAELAKVDRKIRLHESRLQDKGVQQVTVFSSPSGATVSVDRRALGVTPFTFETSPGRHLIELTLPEHSAVQGQFELRPERAIDLKFELSPAVEPGPPPQEQTPTSPPIARELNVANDQRSERALPSDVSVGTWTWVGLGAGAALLGGALVFELRRGAAEDAASKAAQVDYQSKWDDMETQQTLSRVFAGAGSAVLVAGLVGLFLDLNASGSGPQQVGLSACGLSLCPAARGTF